MEIINSYFTFITDKKRKLHSKAVLIISTLAIIVLVDNILGFSYFYHNQRKIEQIKSLCEILKDTTVSEPVKEKLTLMQYNTLNRENFISNIITVTQPEPKLSEDTVFLSIEGK